MSDINDMFGGIFGDIFFGESNVSVYEDNLNDYWERMEVEKYCKHLSELKNKGYRIYRNSDGKHKIIKS